MKRKFYPGYKKLKFFLCFHKFPFLLCHCEPAQQAWQSVLLLCQATEGDSKGEREDNLRKQTPYSLSLLAVCGARRMSLPLKWLRPPPTAAHAAPLLHLPPAAQRLAAIWGVRGSVCGALCAPCRQAASLHTDRCTHCAFASSATGSAKARGHTEGPRRLFGYFLAGQKVSLLVVSSLLTEENGLPRRATPSSQ